MSAILGPDGNPLSLNAAPQVLTANGAPASIESFAEYSPEELQAFVIFIERLLEENHGLQNVVAIQISELGRMARTMQLAFEEWRAEMADPEDPTLDGTVQVECDHASGKQTLDANSGLLVCDDCGVPLHGTATASAQVTNLPPCKEDEAGAQGGWPILPFNRERSGIETDGT